MSIDKVQRLKIIFWFCTLLAFPAVFLFGAALFDLLHSTIVTADPTLKWDASALVGGFVAGTMTIFAGWLAFREAKQSNQESHRVQRMRLLIEHIKAVNTVFYEITEIHKKGCEIGMLSIRNITIKEAASRQNLISTHETAAAVKKIGEMIPKLIEINSPALADACAILPLEVPKMVITVNNAVADLQSAYRQTFVPGINYDVNDLTWRNALNVIFMPLSGSQSKLDQLILCTKEALSTLDQMRTKLSEEYAEIISHYMGAPLKS